MSVCVQTEDESSDEPPAGAPVREMYEAKAVSKAVRVLTVLAYLLSVSLAAILLSVYYVCVWQSPKLPPLNDTDAEARRDALTAHQPFDQHHHSYNHTRGGNTAVSDMVTSPPEELPSLPAESSEPPDPSPTPPDISSSMPIEDSNFTWVMESNMTMTTPDQR